MQNQNENQEAKIDTITAEQRKRIAQFVHTDCTLIPGATFYNAAEMAIEATLAQLATPPSTDAREAGGGAMTDEQHQSMEFAIALLEGRGYTGRAKDLRALLRGAGSD